MGHQAGQGVLLPSIFSPVKWDNNRTAREDC